MMILGDRSFLALMVGMQATDQTCGNQGFSAILKVVRCKERQHIPAVQRINLPYKRCDGKLCHIACFLGDHTQRHGFNDLLLQENETNCRTKYPLVDITTIDSIRIGNTVLDLMKLMEFVGRRIVLALEGGYNLGSFAKSFLACVVSCFEVPFGDGYCPTYGYNRVPCAVYLVCGDIESIWDVKEAEIEQNELGENITEGKRKLMQEALKQQANLKNKLQGANGNVEHCIKWYVEWKRLGYDHYTSELEGLNVLTLVSTKELMKAYELRSEEVGQQASPRRAIKAKKLQNNNFSRLNKLPDWMKGGLDSSHL
eukprot:Gb_19910 [translate_table: standard]